MENIFLSLTKYLFAIFMAIYMIVSFSVLKVKAGQPPKKRYGLQVFLIAAIHAMGFSVIYIQVLQDKIILFYGFQLLYLMLTITIFRMLYPKLDRGLLNNMCMFISVGLIMMTRLSYTRAVRQFIIIVISTVISMSVPYLWRKFKNASRYTWFYAAIGIVLLSLVFLIGKTEYGAKISLGIGSISFQPTEFVKILYVLFIASMFEKEVSIKKVAVSAILAGMHVVIMVLSKDLGSALILTVVYLFMLYVATCKWYLLFGGTLIVSGASVLAYRLFSHVRIRVAAWRDPWSIIDGQGYQITQSLFAIGTGGLLGMGLYQGMPYKIPVVEQDFIFSAISEELGALFAICLILLCINTFLIFIEKSIMHTNLFGKLLALGLAICYGFQIFLTIGGAIKLIPSTGVTLPLISYGGSSMLATIIIFSIMQSIGISNRVEEENRSKIERKQEESE